MRTQALSLATQGSPGPATPLTKGPVHSLYHCVVPWPAGCSNTSQKPQDLTPIFNVVPGKAVGYELEKTASTIS
jgi:hypothetical protein